MSIDDRLKALGIVLPDAPAPLGSYIPCVQSGNLLFLSGILPIKEGILLCRGRVGKDVTIEEAQEASRIIVMNALAVVKAGIGSLDGLSRCIKLNGYVASSDGFHDQPKVINPASDLLYALFGEKGRHARAAVGVYNLPLNAPVEIDFIFEKKD